MANTPDEKITIPSLQARKAAGPKIVCLTAYDHPTARILDEAGVDLILVGDSLGMVVLGYENTVPVTMDEMIHHTRAVTRAVKRALVVGDMPYFSFHLSADETIRNASRFLKEAGAAAVKIEGASPKRLKLVEAMVEAEIPVMGHVGLTPQSIHHLGRYRVRGTAAEGARRIVDDAVRLEKAGAFAVVLESMPVEVAADGHPGGRHPDDRHRGGARLRRPGPRPPRHAGLLHGVSCPSSSASTPTSMA